LSAATISQKLPAITIRTFDEFSKVLL